MKILAHVVATLMTLLVMAHPISAQDQTVDSGTPDTIYLETLFLGGNSYVQNEKKMNAGGVMQHLAPKLAEVPAAHSLALRGVKDLKRSRVFMYLAYGLTAASFFTDTNTQYLAVTGASLATGGFGLHFKNRGQNQIQKAVWTYNDTKWLERYPLPVAADESTY